MSQEITIISMIDIQGALNANKLDGNIYMMDNLRTEGSEGEGTGNLITALNGTYWSDGSQASEVLLNWLISGIGSLPQTLPRNYHKSRTKTIRKHLLNKLGDLNENTDMESLKKINAISQIKDHFGNIRGEDTNILTITGESHIKDITDEPVSYHTPIITDITGEAVEKEVIYPAQYGTPVSIKDGWYWSATADTAKTGVYSYTLHITLFKPTYIKNILTWEPVKMTHESHIKVTSLPKKNGFSNGAMIELPIS